jgi:hypothetical protein
VTIVDARVDQTCARAEIVEAIIDNLRRPKNRSRGDFHAIVGAEIDGLIRRITQGRRPTTETKEVALKLEKAVDTLIQTLNDIPVNNVFALWARHHDLPKILCSFRDLRAAMATEIPSENTNLIKASCAVTSFRLIIMLSVKSPTTTAHGPMQVIASLLYELATGERDADLKRACDACVKKIRKRHARYGLPNF